MPETRESKGPQSSRPTSLRCRCRCPVLNGCPFPSHRWTTHALGVPLHSGTTGRAGRSGGRQCSLPAPPRLTQHPETHRDKSGPPVTCCIPTLAQVQGVAFDCRRDLIACCHGNQSLPSRRLLVRLPFGSPGAIAGLRNDDPDATQVQMNPPCSCP